MHFGIFGLTRNQKTFGSRALPGPAGEVYVLPKPQAEFLERGRGEKREKGDKRRERVGREREGGSNRNFVGGPPCCKVQQCGGEYRLG